MPSWVHTGVLCIGLLAIPFLCLMAWIPDSASPAHFISALIMFGVLAVYELTFALLLVVAGRVLPQWPFPLAALVLWFLACAIIAVASAGTWVASGNNAFEYVAVAFEFAYFVAMPGVFALARPGGKSQGALLSMD